MTLLRIRDLGHGWTPGRPLFTHLDLDVAPGEGVLLGGGNGTGKSTLLQLAAGHLVPWQGSVLVDGARATTARARRRRWFMESAPALYRLLTVREQLRFYAAAHGREETAALEVLAELGMGHLEDSLCAELSSGQAQKVWFAAATACHGAPLLLLDEPFSAVDVESVPVMVSRIERFVAAGGAAVLVTHSHTEHLGGLWRSVALDRSVQRTAPPR
ncbi:ATP-binding cassette domain-containing protein [Kocuria flava]|uniref:ABC transporter ATP-binding protein n=1 Tax=Kocuria flava TaxID=446860 RepID=UPI001FF3C506|nr:ATP-binding cassette domain-containing protein [Kocuria flava]MCJ8504124.1 ATP-binding cassette domain-containing protein [Kocuria flava]